MLTATRWKSYKSYMSSSKLGQEFTIRDHGPGTLAPALVNHFTEMHTFFISFIGFHNLYIITWKRFKKVLDVLVQSSYFQRNSGAWNEL